jgi:hypothetical protein
MARIRATINYEPKRMAEAYPPEVKTKADAMRFDLQQLKDGKIDAFDMIEFAEDITWEVVE